MKATHLPEGEYTTIHEAAKREGISYEAIQKRIQRGRLPAIEVPRLGYLINVKDLDDWQDRREGQLHGRKFTVDTREPIW